MVAGIFVLLLGVLIGHVRAGATATSPSEALVIAMAEREIEVNPSEVLWWDQEPSPMEMSPGLFLGSVDGGNADLYYVEARRAEGTLFAVGVEYNLTRSPSASESMPVRVGDSVMYGGWVRGTFDSVTVLDFSGEPEEVTRGWPERARLQNAVTNRQTTGRWDGVGRVRYNLLRPAERLAIHEEGGAFHVVADGDQTLRIAPGTTEPISGAEYCEPRPDTKGQPGTITWVVDTVRSFSFVGPAPIEWLEHRVFAVKDWLTRAYHAVVGGDAEQEAADAVQDMGLTQEETRRRLELAVASPESGLPPPLVEPILSPPLEGEGQWVPVVDDPFLRSFPGAPPAFYQTFFRPDGGRPFARIYAVLWDSRLVQLNIMSGTREPESATGATARGMAPRDPENIERFVGGFNGGFQALHGEFGMMAEGEVYLPPKPWAATLAVLDDGQVAMGSWQPPPDGVRFYRERWALEQIPERMVSFRQNLTSVVEDDTFNPWGRWWWGAAPVTAAEQTYIHRTGVCLTPEGFMVYLWGRSLGPEGLGQAMLSVGCVRGMHLDMNSRHTGFEFYDVRADTATRPPLGRPMVDGEFEGPVPHIEGFTMRARRAVRTMTHMRFPRYIDRDPRDFFYLSIKPTLPGGPLPGDPRATFSSTGLPHAGWPYALARATTGDTTAVRVDPQRAVPGPIAGSDMTEPLAYLSGAEGSVGSHALYATRQLVGWRYGVGEAPEGATVLIRGRMLEEGTDSGEAQAGAAIGVDADGFLVYVEPGAGESRSIWGVMRLTGVGGALALSEGQRLSFNLEGQAVSPDGYAREVVTGDTIVFHANARPAGAVLFPEVAPRPYREWARLQDSRVRYFRDDTRPPRFTAPGATQ